MNNYRFKQVSLIVFILFIVIGECKSQEFIKLYLNDNFEATDSLNASYIREVKIENGRFYITEQNIKGQITHYGEYISVNPWVEDGKTMHFIQPDQLYAKGSYQNGKLAGDWLYFNQDQTVDTVSYDLVNIESITEDCSSINYTKRFNRRETLEIQSVVDSFTEFFENNFHLPARTRKNTLTFNVNIHFLLEDDGIIQCLKIKDIEDEDLITEIQRIVSKFSYVKKSKKPLIIDFDLMFDGRTFIKYESKDGSAVDEAYRDAYVIVEQMPSFDGKGYEHFVEFIAENITYPEQAGKYGIRGVVFVQFIVEKDGSVSNVRLIKGVDPLLDNEAIRVIKSSPKWEPGRQKGEPVRVVFNIPILFSTR